MEASAAAAAAAAAGAVVRRDAMSTERVALPLLALLLLLLAAVRAASFRPDISNEIVAFAPELSNELDEYPEAPEVRGGVPAAVRVYWGAIREGEGARANCLSQKKAHDF